MIAPLRLAHLKIACLALLAAGVSHAIEVPKPSSAPPTTSAPQRDSITPSDEKEFQERLQLAMQRRNLRELKIPDEVPQLLARGEADAAVALLTQHAAEGDEHATVALVRVQNWCGRMVSARPADPQAQIAKLSSELSTERAARAAGVLMAEAEYRQRARESCSRAVFDYGGIESQLRRAAAAGDPASATELAQFTRDSAQRETMLQTAADKDYAPAMYALAMHRLVAVQRGETTENVASIRALLKKAGQSLPKAKLDLANCMALGCDGHPANSAAAAAFGLDAARDGEPTAYLSMVRMPWGRRFSRPELLAWQYFGERLNEAGCMGEAYVASATAFTQAIQALEKGQDAKVIQQAKAQAEDLWRDYGARAMQEQGCG